MTREEAITYGERKKARIQEKLCRDESSYGDHSIYYSEMEFTSAALSALREQEERRWIPVTERLPDDGEQVIVVATGKPESNVTLDNAIEFAEFSIDEGWILEMWPDWETPLVTYWMPLPELPKGE